MLVKAISQFTNRLTVCISVLVWGHSWGFTLGSFCSDDIHCFLAKCGLFCLRVNSPLIALNSVFSVCRQHPSVFLFLIWSKTHSRWATLYLWARPIDLLGVGLTGWERALVCVEFYKQTQRLTVRHQALDPPPVAMVRKREPFLTAICGPPLEHFYCLGREFEELVKNGQVCGFYENSAAPNRGTCLFWLASVERSYLCRKLKVSI